MDSDSDAQSREGGWDDSANVNKREICQILSLSLSLPSLAWFS